MKIFKENKKKLPLKIENYHQKQKYASNLLYQAFYSKNSL